MRIHIMTKVSLNGLLPALLRLEKNWTAIGEKPWQEKEFYAELKNKWRSSIFAEEKGKILGYMICSYDHRILKLHKILVDSSVRGKGIATSMWRYLHSICAKESIDRMEFKVRSDNSPAINFYRKNGCLILDAKACPDQLRRHDVIFVFKARSHIKHSSPSIDEADIKSVIDALRSGDLATGRIVHAFEEKMRARHKRKHALAVSSGTAALHLALLALDIEKGDEIILPSFACYSLLAPILQIGAKPVFADINCISRTCKEKDNSHSDFNLSFADVKKRISKKTKAIILPHMFGTAMKDIADLKRLKVPIIEDCAHSIGAKFPGTKTLTGMVGDMAVFSFFATKMMTTAVGGMILTDDKQVYRTLKDLTGYDNRESLGTAYNYRMSDIDAALGISQLDKLDRFIERRRKLASQYSRYLKTMDFHLQKPIPHPSKRGSGDDVFFRYILLHKRRDHILKTLQSKGVDCRLPVYRPLHRYLKISDDGYPNTMAAFDNAVSLPIYPSLTDEMVKDISGLLIDCVKVM